MLMAVEAESVKEMGPFGTSGVLRKGSICPRGSIFPYKAATTRPHMSVLANHPFTKMNGLGNEIVVVDMRRQAGTISAQDARAAAAPNGVPYDQLMALHAPRKHRGNDQQRDHHARYT